MDFSYSDIQALLVESASRLLGEQSGVEYWRERRSSPEPFDRNRWRQFAELGWLALMVPEEAGGVGGSLEDMALLHIELGRALATEPVVSSAVAGVHILSGAQDSGAGELLGKIASGSLTLALAHLEPGDDPLTVHTPASTAQRTDRGFILNGIKQMALDAPGADRLIVSAGLDGDGTALFLLESRASGLTLDPYALVDGTRAADVRLDGVAVPPEALLAGGNRGVTLLTEAIDVAQIALMAQAVGSMEACLSICGDYAKERRQFGAAIASFQAIQHILADMFVAAHQARSMLYHAVSASHGEATGRSAAISAARIVVGEASLFVARSGIQVHGGYGLTDEYAISHHYRRLMTLEKLLGDTTDHLQRFGGVVLD